MEESVTLVGKFIDPGAIIKQLDTNPGDIVADFGCGPGYFSLPFASAIGESGHLYALDVLPQALESVMSKAKISGLVNISTKRVNLEKKDSSGLPGESIDWVIMKDVLFQNQKKEAILAEAHRILKKEGKVILVEWNEKNSAMGPDEKVRISKKQLEEIMATSGFKIENKINAGDFHYAFVGVKA